jgi:hypothetical protein
MIVDFDETDYNLIGEEIERCIVDLKNKNSFEREESDEFEEQNYLNQGKCAKTSGQPGNLSCNVIEEYKLINLKTNIKKYMNEYFYSIHKKPIQDSIPWSGTAPSCCPIPLTYNIYSSWMVLSNEYSYTPVHNHIGLNVSGVYYHKVFENSGIINFRSIDKCPEMSYFYKGNPNYPIEPKNGRLILFPSWIDHYSTSNETENERICLSFVTHFTNNFNISLH